MYRFFLIFFLISVSVFSQHHISGKFYPEEDYNFVMLYRIEPTQHVFVTNSMVEDDGSFRLNLNASERPGMYKLVYGIPEEEYNFDVVFTGKEDVELTFSEKNGLKFKGGENEVLYDFLDESYHSQEKISAALAKEKPLKEEINRLFLQYREMQKAAEAKTSSSLVKKFIKANQEYIPEKFENKAAYDIYRKTHFFDAFDFNDKDLQQTTFGIERIKRYYYEFVIVTGGGGYQSVIDDIVRETNTVNKDYQKELITDFWQFLMNANRQHAGNYLALRHLIPLSKNQGDHQLAEMLEQIIKSAVGAKAPNFELKRFDENKTLHDLNGSEYYALIFWSSECPHCVDQLPKIYEAIKAVPKEKVQTITIGIEYEADTWKKMTDEYKSFINVLALDEWRDELVQEYNISATPSFFILNKDKMIISKPRGTANFLKAVESAQATEVR